MLGRGSPKAASEEGGKRGKKLSQAQSRVSRGRASSVRVHFRASSKRLFAHTPRTHAHMQAALGRRREFVWLISVFYTPRSVPARRDSR